uniref:Reverse transcriptase domain-containing protein n=1 Tax=Fagus sylvatica TaxID=28930 RepID=A0A2N9J5I9_FAGSY
MHAILDKWIANGLIRPAERPPTEEQKKHERYCCLHQYVHHPTIECRTLRKMFQTKIKDETLELSKPQQEVQRNPLPQHERGATAVVIHGNVADLDMDKEEIVPSESTIMALQKSPKFRSLFDQLGLGAEARKMATGALVSIVAESGAQSQYPDHKRPLYLTVSINEVQVRPALVDTGSSLNLIPVSTLQAANISRRKVQVTPMKVIDFGGAAEYTIGHIQLALKEDPNKKLGRAIPSCCAIQEAVRNPDEGSMEEPREEVDYQPSLAAKDLEVINLSDNPDTQRPISISASLSAGEKTSLVKLLKEYQDVFIWQYDQMPGLDPGLVAHALNVEPGIRPVIQLKRTFHLEVEAQITKEIQKLLAVGFVKPIQHPQWLSNIVPVKKKNGQIRCCVDFRNLNKAYPKDEFPLPSMDVLIDSAAGHEMFSFMDGFSGYNQIRMSPKDAEKTAFRTPIGNFYYTVMPFGLKNAGATYQRTMTTIFHDMMHREIEDYVDDVVVKSKTREGHLETLRKVLERCRVFKLRMNPLKCAFGVSAGKFLGFLVHKQGIDVDPAKSTAIATMKPPTNVKQLKSFLRRLSYIRRFIPGLALLTSSFSHLLKKNMPFVWSQECQKAFETLKQIMSKLPTVCAPVMGKPLKLYLASNNQAIGALIAQDDEQR